MRRGEAADAGCCGFMVIALLAGLSGLCLWVANSYG